MSSWHQQIAKLTCIPRSSSFTEDFGLPSWLLGPEDEVASTTVKTDVKLPTFTDLADKSQESASEQCAPKEKTNASLDVQTATNQENDIDMDEPNKTTDHPEDNFNKNQQNFSANQDDPLLKDLEQSVGSILDIRSYNKAVQDQNRMINLLIKQQSRYMSRLINRIGAIQGNDELTIHQTTNADNDEQNHQVIKKLSIGKRSSTLKNSTSESKSDLLIN